MSQMTLTDGQIVRLRELVCSLKLPALPSTRHYEDIRMNVFFRALDPARQAFLAREEGETFDRAARRVLQLCLKNELRDLHAGQAVFEQEMSALAELEMADESGKPAFDVADPRTADGVGSASRRCGRSTGHCGRFAGKRGRAVRVGWLATTTRLFVLFLDRIHRMGRIF